jgi:hypothetical protein
VRQLAEIILRHLCDLTGENTTLTNPKTRIQRIQVFAADRLAMWLAGMMGEYDKQNGDDSEKGKGAGGEPQKKPPSKQHSKPPGKTPTKPPSKAGSASPSKPPSQSANKEPSKSDSKEPSKLATEEPSKSASKEPSKPSSKEPSKPPSKEPSKPPSKEPSKPPSKEPSKPSSKEPSKSASKEPSKPSSQEPSKTASKEPSKSASKEPSKPPSKEPSKPPSKEPSKPSSKEPSKPPSKEPSKPSSKEPSKPPSRSDSKNDEAKKETDPSKTPPKSPTKPPKKSKEDSDKSKEEADKELHDEKINDAMEVVKDWIEKTEPETTDRQKSIQETVVDRLESEMGGGKPVDDITMGAINDVGSKVSTWVDKLVSEVEEEELSNKGAVFRIKKGDGSYYDVKQIGQRSVCEKVARARSRSSDGGRRIEGAERKAIDKEEMKEWAGWAADAVTVAAQWADWIEKTVSDAEEKAARKKGKVDGPKLTKQEWKTWQAERQKGATEYTKLKKDLNEKSKKWQEKLDKTHPY